MASQPHYVTMQYPSHNYSQNYYGETPIRTSYVKVQAPQQYYNYPPTNSIATHNQLTSSISSHHLNLPVTNSVTYLNEDQEPMTEYRYIEYVPIEHRIVAPANTNPEHIPQLKSQFTYEQPIEFEYIAPRQEYAPTHIEYIHAPPQHTEYFPQPAYQVKKNYVVATPKQEPIQTIQNAYYLPSNQLRASSNYIQQPIISNSPYFAPANHEQQPYAGYRPVAPSQYQQYPVYSHSSIYQQQPQAYPTQLQPHIYPSVNEQKKSGFSSSGQGITVQPQQYTQPQLTPRIYDLPQGITQTSQHAYQEPKKAVVSPPTQPKFQEQAPQKQADKKFSPEANLGKPTGRRVRGDYQSLE